VEDGFVMGEFTYLYLPLRTTDDSQPTILLYNTWSSIDGRGRVE